MEWNFQSVNFDNIKINIKPPIKSNNDDIIISPTSEECTALVLYKQPSIHTSKYDLPYILIGNCTPKPYSSSEIKSGYNPYSYDTYGYNTYGYNDAYYSYHQSKSKYAIPTVYNTGELNQQLDSCFTNKSKGKIKYNFNYESLYPTLMIHDNLDGSSFILNNYTGSRESLIDTHVKTKESGYIQRKIVKTLDELASDCKITNSTKVKTKTYSSGLRLGEMERESILPYGGLHDWSKYPSKGMYYTRTNPYFNKVSLGDYNVDFDGDPIPKPAFNTDILDYLAKEDIMDCLEKTVDYNEQNEQSNIII
jgi:hypothetical protein